MRTIINNRIPAALLLLAGSGLVLSACAGAPADTPDAAADTGTQATQGAQDGFPLTVENCGRTLEFDAPPQRIVTLEQTLTELSLALGATDQMVGTSYRTDPVMPELQADYARVPVLAELYPAQEVVLQAEPDFLYAYGPYSVSAEGAGTLESYEALGVPVYITAASCPDEKLSAPVITFDGFFEEVRTIARIYGLEEAGEKLIAAQQARIDDALAAAPDLDASFVWWYAGTDTPYFGTGSSDASNYADLLGLENAFEDGGPGRWASTSWEIIAERDPDVIVLADLTRGNDGDSAQSKIDYLKANPATAQLSAVVEDRFIVVPASARGYSIRTVESLELIVQGLRDLYDAD